MGAQVRVLARWLTEDSCERRGGGDRLALPPALLSQQLLLRCETFAARRRSRGTSRLLLGTRRGMLLKSPK